MPALKDPYPSYNPGSLRHIILILKQVDRVDNLGQPQQVYETIWTTRGAIDDQANETKATGREFYQDGLVAARVSHVITIRHSKVMPQIIPGMRAMFVDQRYSPPVTHTYLIEFIENADMKDILLRIGCWEINAP